MKKIEKICKIIAAIILIPTVLLVAFILIADVTGMEFNKNSTTTELVQENHTGAADASEEEQAGMVTDISGNDGEESTGEAEQTDGKITAEKYEQIQNGMTYQELVALIGEEGNLTAESETLGSKTVMYEWTAEDGWGTAIIVLQDNAVINKSQTGVAQSAETAPITLEQYEQIEEGMTYDKVVEIIGGEGEAISESNTEDSITVVYIWKGSDGVSNATLTFYNNALFSKAQTGLQ